MENPAITIITINYNNKEGLARTFDSVFSQTFKQLEYIVIDGGSNDGSKNIIEANSSKINYWVSEPDKGIYNAMNKGIKAAKGTFITFINSGDELYDPLYIEQAMENASGFDIIYGNLFLIGEKKSWVKSFPENISLLFFFRDSIPHPATFIRRSLFETVGLYDEKLKIVSDWKWYLLAICKYDAKYKNVNKVAARFYLDGISGNEAHHEKLKAERDSVIKENFEHLSEVYKYQQSLENQLFSMQSSFFVRILSKLGLLKRPSNH